MDRLPDEITLRIISFIATSEWQLLELEKVSRKLGSIAQDQTLWYQLFQQNFKNWGYHIPYACGSTLIDWRAFVIHLAKQKRRSRSLTFDFVRDETPINRKRKIHELIRSSSSPSPPSSKNMSPHQDILNTVDISYQPNNESTMISTSNDDMDMIGSFIDLAPHGPSSSIPQTEPSFDRESLRHLFTRPSSSFHIQDPLVVDINHVTQTGVVATGKHRKTATTTGGGGTHSEHKILFWDYPSWRLIRELEMHFVPSEMTCQVVGIQTVKIKKIDTDTAANGMMDQSYQSIRLFALAIGQPIGVRGQLHINNDGGGEWHLGMDDDDDAGMDENDDRVDLWQVILIYRLFDDGTTQCLANIPLDGRFMGREVFFFSDYSWAAFGDTDDDDESISKSNIRHWLQMVAPEHMNYDPHFTLFMLAIGPTFPDTDGCGKLIQCDLRGDSTIVDPALTLVTWNPILRRLVPARRGSMPLSSYQHHCQQEQQRQRPSHIYGYPSQQQKQHYQNSQDSLKETPSHMSPVSAKIIHTAYLGSHVSCMIHFRYPTKLNHLICTGSYSSNELSIYDWRFGVKVGTLPWKTDRQQQERRRRRNNRRIPSQNQPIHHNPEQPQRAILPTSPATVTRPNNVNGNQFEPMELNDAATIFEQMLARNQRDRFDQLTEQMIQQQQNNDDEHIPDNNNHNHNHNDDADELDFQHEVRPWGLESTMVLPPYWDHRAPNNEELAHRGFRLIAVGDNRMNRLEIKIWDISFLLKQVWDPLQHYRDKMDSIENDDDGDDILMVDLATTPTPATADDDMDDWQKRPEWTKLFPWWRRGSRYLQLLALRLTFDRVQWDEQHYHFSSIPIEIRHLFQRDPKLRHLAKRVDWPLSPPTSIDDQTHRTILLDHTFDRPPRPDGSNFGFGSIPSTMTVKYTAYNVLCTSLFLLTEDGKVTVLDIETGQVTGAIDNVAATAAARMDPMLSSSTGRVRGIDINVVSGHEVVVTSREGLLRSILF